MQDDKDIATGGEDQNTDPYANMRNSKPWLEAIKESEKFFQTYQDKCDNIDKLYADLKTMSEASVDRQMQIFWANLEVLKPAIYSRPPVPVVVAKFKDRKPILRHASEVLERSLISSFDQEDINETMMAIRDDLAISARGVPWLRLEDDEEGSQKVCYDHLDRKDFLHGVARKWKEVPWVARCVYLNREKMQARFEEASGKAWLEATYEECKKDGEDYTAEKKAKVYEMWHKEKGVVVWITPGVDTVLDIQPPFLQLHGFFPCPRPAYGTVERGTLRPVPDFVYYKDQIEEINELTARISSLAESLRLKGFYAGGDEDVGESIERVMRDQDNRAILVPVTNFAAMGGPSLKDAIIWLPVAEVATVIASLVELRKQLIDDVYQITGISDIMRGSTDANETLGAQQLKSQYGSIRVRDRQQELIRIARDMTRIAAEIMAENFRPGTVMQYSQYDEVPTQAQVQEQLMGIQQQMMQGQMSLMQAANDPQKVAEAQANPEIAQQAIAQVEQQKQQLMQQAQEIQSQVTFEQVLEFIASERTRPFTLEIETDSTIQPDEDAQKQRATEFLGALATTLSQLAPMVQQQPQSAEFAGEVLKFALNPFRAGRSLEQSVDSFVDQMKQVAAEPQESPEDKKLNAEMQIKMAELQIKQTDSQAKLAESQAKTQTAVQQAQADLELTNAKIEEIFAKIEQIGAQTEAAEREPREAAE
jgi:hypothetical protein